MHMHYVLAHTLWNNCHVLYKSALRQNEYHYRCTTVFRNKLYNNMIQTHFICTVYR